MIKVAINGFGRIGRHAFKVIWERKDMEVVAINDLTENDQLAHLLKYDTAYPTFNQDISFDENAIHVGKSKVVALSERDPAALPWKDLGVDVVLECTGVFRTKEKASAHITAGAKKVIISAPAKGDDVQGYVRGVNCETYNGDIVIDNASCTTNCTAPVVSVIDSVFGIEKAMLTTIHSYTADQNIQDGPHKKDLRRARAAAQNIVPTTTGAAKATTKILPQLAGKFDGIAVRVPTITVSLTDFTFLLKKDVTAEDINAALEKASKKELKGVLSVTTEPLVSSDFIGNSYSSTADLSLTKVVDGNLVKIIAWYDNEWGYANRLVEMAEKMSR